ncbi:MAG: hypothetical protein IT211_10440 [Armatimonadetes bacterium]|nr:hypothetical protein [Armatimonadota bacterium]
MFSKHVWYDRRHQAEVFISDDGQISGAIIAYKGAVFVVNPRPEIMTALYQEGKIKRILSLKGVVLTDTTMEYTRGVCSLVSYSRALRRKSPFAIITRDNTAITSGFLASCCTQLVPDGSFQVQLTALPQRESFVLGEGLIRYEPQETTESSGGSPCLVVETRERRIHFYDETHVGSFNSSELPLLQQPHVVIRAANIMKSFQPIEQRVLQVAR